MSDTLPPAYKDVVGQNSRHPYLSRSAGSRFLLSRGNSSKRFMRPQTSIPNLMGERYPNEPSNPETISSNRRTFPSFIAPSGRRRMNSNRFRGGRTVEGRIRVGGRRGRSARGIFFVSPWQENEGRGTWDQSRNRGGDWAGGGRGLSRIRGTRESAWGREFVGSDTGDLGDEGLTASADIPPFLSPRGIPMPEAALTLAPEDAILPSYEEAMALVSLNGLKEPSM
ncbi:unnamed protein product [Protopolystoma xenopodis]|uniref:Uncharacterized protein n=1 Tax=Protopolystoma xenopodis TaxID=117903 RepID=A0A3S5CQC9_9PLAT|nr:unnamed protein product [Protopolystoma xenopodis]